MTQSNLARLQNSVTDLSAEIRQAFTEDDPNLSARTRVLFDPSLAREKLIRCEKCNEIRLHNCIEARGIELARKVSANIDRSMPICLLCFRKFFNRMHLLGHYLVHSPHELSSIGVSDQLVLKFINERYP